MNALRWIKDSALSLLLAMVGILAVLLTHFRHQAKQLKDQVKRTHHTIKTNRAQVKVMVEQAKKREEELNEIQSDTYNPRDSFGRFDK